MQLRGCEMPIEPADTAGMVRDVRRSNATVAGGEFTDDILAELHCRVTASLSRWQLSPGTTVELLNVSENATFQLRDPAGSEVMLRVHRRGYSSVADIRSELAWVDALRRDGVVETAVPLCGADGDTVQALESCTDAALRYAVAFQRLPGREPRAADAPYWFERLGELTARMHRHATSWTVPPGFSRKRWDVDAMVGERGLWGPWRAARGLELQGAKILERAVAAIRRRLERFGTEPGRFGLIHADLRLANLLVDGPQLRAIDFDDCGFGWLIYDFAASVSFIEHEPVVPELLAAWCSGYRATSPLSAAAQAEIPTFVVLRRILLTAWLASHAEIPFARNRGACFTMGTVSLADAWMQGAYLRHDNAPSAVPRANIP